MWTFVPLFVLLFGIFYYVDYNTNAIITKAQRQIARSNSSSSGNSSSDIFDLVDVLVHQTPKKYLTLSDTPPTVHK